MKEAFTIYIADDHQIIIDGLTLLLKNESKFQIIGSGIDGQQCMNEIEKLRPDLALIDLRMPEKDGLQVLRSLKNKVRTKFIILSMHQDTRFISDAQNYGADAYLLKNAGKEELINTLNKVLDGEKCFPVKKASSQETFLSSRELEVFRYVINGHTSAQIAGLLSLSQFTVETHRKNIMRKTQAKNAAGLMKFAMENNIPFN